MHRADWLCPVCQSQLKSPVVTTCGHTFCWPCLRTHLQTSSACPVCSKYLSKENIVPIYGQAGEADISDLPPPPKPAAPEKPQEEEPRGNNFEGDTGGWHVQYGFMPFGFGATFQFGGNFNTGNQHRANRQGQQQNNNSKIMRIVFTIIVVIIMNLLFGY